MMKLITRSQRSFLLAQANKPHVNFESLTGLVTLFIFLLFDPFFITGAIKTFAVSVEWHKRLIYNFLSRVVFASNTLNDPKSSEVKFVAFNCL